MLNLTHKKSNNKKQMPSRRPMPCLGLFFSAVQQMALIPNDWLSYVLMHVEGAMAESNPWGVGGWVAEDVVYIQVRSVRVWLSTQHCSYALRLQTHTNTETAGSQTRK